MAARRQHFSREEVIEQVLVENEQTEEDEVSLNDILETSISNFTALWRSISNYTHFREEARQLMLNVYHRHEVGVHGMDKSHVFPPGVAHDHIRGSDVAEQDKKADVGEPEGFQSMDDRGEA